MAVSSFLTLRSGAKLPSVGLGVWKISKESTASVVVEALKMGYRHLDCACDYGNEQQVGEGIQRALQEGVIASREELWVTSKLWNTYHAKEHVPLALQRTLDDLGLDYLDLYLVHFPIALKFVPFEERYPPEWVFDPSQADGGAMEYARVPMQETWEAMEELLASPAATDDSSSASSSPSPSPSPSSPAAAAKVRNIGLCNVNAAGLRDLLNYAKVPPAVLQIERHAYLQQPKLMRYCEDAGVAVTGFSPLGSSSYVELDMATPGDSALAEPAVAAIAEKHRRSPAQVLLRWGLDTGTAVIPKSSKVARLAENLDVFDFSLDEEDLEALSVLDKNRRFNDPGDFTTGMNSFCPIYD